MVEKITLFHISNFKDYEPKIFIPRVPSDRAGGEDSEQLRICVSDTIEGCIKGHPELIYYMNLSNNPAEAFLNKEYLLEKGVFGFLMRLYTFQVPKAIVRFPEELEKENLVPDIHLSNEHWIVEPKVPSKVQYLLITEGEIILNRDFTLKNENYEYLLFDSIEEVGLTVSCYDLRLHQKFIKERYPKVENDTLWTTKLSREMSLDFIRYVSENRHPVRRKRRVSV